MNPSQMAQQLKHKLELVEWPSGEQKVVFGKRNVFVYAGAVSDEDHPPGFPFAFVTLDGGEPDDDHPDFITQQFTIAVTVNVTGDPHGEWAVIGGARADVGRSAGAGVAEVSERARFAVQDLTGADGSPIQVSGSAVQAPSALGDSRHVATEIFTVTAQCTSQPYYSEPQKLVHVDSVFTWDDRVEERFDFLRYRLGYVAGTVPARTPEELHTVVYTGTNNRVDHAKIDGSTYSVFADYGRRGGTEVVASSAGDLTGAFLV